ncbi:MAG: DUF2231 domain-containing protein [Bacteroidales bacterium]
MFTEAHIHPMVVHFPIALGMTGYLFYFLYFFFKRDSKCFEFFSFLTMALAAVAAMVAVFTGSYFTFDLTGADGVLKNTHSNYASATLTFFSIGAGLQILFWIWKKDLNYYRWPVFIAYTVGFILVMITGFYGGSIVYDHLLEPAFR